MSERWVTFDCYGTLIDWEGGIARVLAELWPTEDPDHLLRRYHDLEAAVEATRPDAPYRRILAATLVRLAEEEDLPLASGAEERLAASLPSWPPFPEVPEALAMLGRQGWRLGILSNTDPDLLAASLERIGVPVDLTVTQTEARSYKPEPGHWERFFELSGADPTRHVHVAASLFHDIAPCAELSLQAVWINRPGEVANQMVGGRNPPRAAELPDLSDLPRTLETLVPAGG